MPPADPKEGTADNALDVDAGLLEPGFETEHATHLTSSALLGTMQVSQVHELEGGANCARGFKGAAGVRKEFLLPSWIPDDGNWRPFPTLSPDPNWSPPPNGGKLLVPLETLGFC